MPVCQSLPGVFKPFRSLYSAPLRDPPLRARPHSVESTVVCCTWLRKYRSPPFEFHVSAVHGKAEHRSTRRVVVRAYGRAPKALHRHQTALATDIESSRLAAPAIVARIQPIVQWSFTFGASVNTVYTGSKRYSAERHCISLTSRTQASSRDSAKLCLKLEIAASSARAGRDACRRGSRAEPSRWPPRRRGRGGGKQRLSEQNLPPRRTVTARAASCRASGDSDDSATPARLVSVERRSCTLWGARGVTVFQPSSGGSASILPSFAHGALMVLRSFVRLHRSCFTRACPKWTRICLKFHVHSSHHYWRAVTYGHWQCEV